ncbi:MAG: bifunctional glutamate N-acetyltransferase/amino-acid acetyltransferase ArgJ [Spirochaetaceae bacterium]|jgi:glutamate N-acetyltransferase/amino-acid N-acetyltransferase|nr:bifunctional glutamate N-acetyltransferase/amino-acid acetyltransferase ArgJ [Spirochaetaceae bacterium]
MKEKEIDGGICAARGFRAGGIWCGIKAASHKPDLALLVSEYPCTAAAVFTTNQVQAASILVTKEHLKHGTIRALIANSGNANACTGETGLNDARRMAALVAGAFTLPEHEVAVASTGVIGVPLPLAALEAGMDSLVRSLRADAAGSDAALEAIMTTDTRKKTRAVALELGGVPVHLGAIVKGSGMIHPNMATMLAFITTDAGIKAPLLDSALRQAVSRSFNRLVIDGDTSTNDMVLIMANGAAKNKTITALDADYAIFVQALEQLCISLVMDMAKDGEGATKMLSVTVDKAADEKSAEILARAVAASSLVKTAIFGSDANWGRVLCALGYAGVAFNPDRVAVSFASAAGVVQVCQQGSLFPFSEAEAKKVLSEECIGIHITVGDGNGTATVWGCDLSYDYIKINGDYRS